MASTIVLITGANSGVGLATAKVLAANSKNFHIILATRSVEKGNAAMADIEATGIKGTLSTVQLDVTDDNSIEAAAAFVTKSFGRLDVLVNNAGIARGDSEIRTRFRTVYEVNVIGPVAVSAAFKPLLLKSANPYSIYVSSAVGSLAMASDPTSRTYASGRPEGNAYRSSKSALNFIVIQEAIQSASAGLKVFAFCPGLVESALRGPSQEARTSMGNAKDPMAAGEGILRIIQGKRDADVGKLVHAGNFIPGGEGVYPW